MDKELDSFKELPGHYQMNRSIALITNSKSEQWDKEACFGVFVFFWVCVWGVILLYIRFLMVFIWISEWVILRIPVNQPVQWNVAKGLCFRGHFVAPQFEAGFKTQPHETTEPRNKGIA